MNEFAQKPAWHDSKIKVWLMVIIFWPIGLYGLYSSRTISNFTKLAIPGVIILTLIVISMIGSARTDTLVTAIKNGDITTLQEYDFKSIKQIPVVYFAVDNGTPEVLGYFISKGYEVIAKGYNPETENYDKTYNAIFKAIENNNPEMLSVLSSVGGYNIMEWTEKYRAHKADLLAKAQAEEQRKAEMAAKIQIVERIEQGKKYWPSEDDVKTICAYLTTPAMAAVNADQRGYSRLDIVTMAKNTQGLLADKIPDIAYVDWFQPLAYKLIAVNIYESRHGSLRGLNDVNFNIICRKMFEEMN